jgi:Cft2 family RNA processing exonuclease
VNTLRRGGNVLVPVQPTGRIYDLFELVIGAITNETVF